MTIKHAFNNPKADGGDATIARPGDWNADHVITGDVTLPGALAVTTTLAVTGAATLSGGLGVGAAASGGVLCAYHSVGSGGLGLPFLLGNPAVDATSNRVRARFAPSFGFTGAPSFSPYMESGVENGATLATYFAWATYATGSTATERLRLDSVGNLWPSVTNVASCGKSGNLWTAIWATNNVIQTSDARTKKGVADSALGLDFINALRPVSYQWIDEGADIVPADDEPFPGKSKPAPQAHVDTRTHWGLIAQEVKAAADKAGVDFGGYVTDPNGDGLIYSQLIAPLIKAVQELSAQVADLKAKKA